MSAPEPTAARVWVQVDPEIDEQLTLGHLREFVQDCANLENSATVLVYTSRPPCEIRPVRIEARARDANLDHYMAVLRDTARYFAERTAMPKLWWWGRP